MHQPTHQTTAHHSSPHGTSAPAILPSAPMVGFSLSQLYLGHEKFKRGQRGVGGKIGNIFFSLIYGKEGNFCFIKLTNA